MRGRGQTSPKWTSSSNSSPQDSENSSEFEMKLCKTQKRWRTAGKQELLKTAGSVNTQNGKHGGGMHRSAPYWGPRPEWKMSTNSHP